MFTMKIYEGQEGIFKNCDDAIKYMQNTNYEREVSVYDINADSVHKKVLRIYEEIKKYNKGKPLNTQILPSLPFCFRGILSCLGVHVCTISLGTYEKNHECIALLTGLNKDVLDTSAENAVVRPGIKALSSLAIMSGML